jgi:deoxyribodipyrimidine photo-lyase
MEAVSIFWFRRDLRLEDNTGLFHALKEGGPVLPIFIFDRYILDELEDRDDARVTFIHQELQAIQQRLEEEGRSMRVYYGFPDKVWPSILEEFQVTAVYTNHDYEPYAIKRDKQVQQLLEEQDIPFHTYKDHVLFEKNEVVKDDGDPYVVFTPYSRTWKAKMKEMGDEAFPHYPSEDLLGHFVPTDPLDILSLEDMGFEASSIEFPPREVPRKRIREYADKRNFPAQQGTSRLGVHFRFGTVSIREKAKKALELNETYLNELIWRDFYAMILAHFPHVVKGPFRKKYEYIEWRNQEEEFNAWCAGKTGYPIVDAGMRELNATGYMHNRIRMVVASFLTKHLLIDWRWGEAYFARKLLDYELASNNGGWQWAAGTGTDAAPYFRIFNPESQQKKFDKNLKYIRQWVPEFESDEYPAPIVDHKMARERCLNVYKESLEKADQEMKS